jgi:hypothetical protein
MPLYNQINILQNENSALKLELNNKLIEMQNLKNTLNNMKIQDFQSHLRYVYPGEIILPVQFSLNNQTVSKSIPCKNTDLFVRIEEQLYEVYPQYKNFNTYFTVNGNVIKRFKSIQENGIKNSDIVLLNIYQ